MQGKGPSHASRRIGILVRRWGKKIPPTHMPRRGGKEREVEGGFLLWWGALQNKVYKQKGRGGGKKEPRTRKSSQELHNTKKKKRASKVTTRNIASPGSKEAFKRGGDKVSEGIQECRRKTSPKN